jgi:RNA polymerase sigma factor (TIGR02999 family)
MPDPADVTRLLREGGADHGQLLSLLYDDLKAVAARRMAAERPDHTLQATALVHEAYVRLVGQERLEWRDRKHFYGAAAEVMRRILVDHARRVKSHKRGGGALRVTLGAAAAPELVDADRLLDLDQALERLAAEDAAAAEVTRLRFFAGLTAEETALALDTSLRTVHRQWTYARARLAELIGDDGR